MIDITNKETVINEAREVLSKLVKAINNHTRRNLMPYDWIDMGHPELIILCYKLKVDSSDGHLKKQDKRGMWR